MNKNHSKEKVRVIIPSNTKHLHTMRLLTQTLAQSVGFGEKDCEKAALAVEEALTNVMEHSFHGEPRRKMEVIFELQQDKFTVRILHNGDQIKNNHIPTAEDFSNFHLQKKKGGLGILLMKRFMDEVEYKTGPKLNECCMVKYLRKNA